MRLQLPNSFLARDLEIRECPFPHLPEQDLTDNAAFPIYTQTPAEPGIHPTICNLICSVDFGKEKKNLHIVWMLQSTIQCANFAKPLRHPAKKPAKYNT